MASPRSSRAFHAAHQSGITRDIHARPRLVAAFTAQEDTIDIGDLPLCRVLVIKDAHYPWLLLVPRRLRLWKSSTSTKSSRRS